jgi:hypothetical protein
LARDLKKLDKGDSFFIKCAPSKWRNIRSNLSVAVKRINKKKIDPIAITTRGYDDGIRVWRTK